MNTSHNQTEFDADALRNKYRSERDKRLRTDGNEQYQEVTGKFAHFISDPYVSPDNRAPISDFVEIAIIGGGFGGLLAGARLKEAGITDVRIIEKGGDFGGTWYWNRYPGAQCDIESYIYLPLLEELDYIPKEKYTHAPEMLQHSRAIGQHYSLYDKALFQTEVTGMSWDDKDKEWNLETNRGDNLRARYVCMSNGPLNRPKLPAINGIEDFKGHTFHTSRWDYGYTGGTTEGKLDKLADKKVGIIGTGATAVQCVPHLAQAAKSLTVFQRTPSSIDVRGNRPTDAGWAKSLDKGWQKHRMTNFNVLVTGGHQDEDLVSDGWTDIIRKLSLLNASRANDGEVSPEEMAEQVELADFEKMEQIRARVDSVVADPKTADALKPWYRQFCKRPCFHDEYLKAFNQDNVNLVDTNGKGVQQITENGVLVDGVEYELDCIIFATGFEVGTDYTRRAGYEITGKDGTSLTDKWRDGLRTLHGFQTNGFPNCFFMGVTQGGFTANFPHMLDEQSAHIAYMIGHANNNNYHSLEASKEAEDEWVATMESMAVLNQKFQEDCTPGYYNNEGQVGNKNSLFASQYGAGPEAFFELIDEWREEGTLQGLKLS